MRPLGVVTIPFIFLSVLTSCNSNSNLANSSDIGGSSSSTGTTTAAGTTNSSGTSASAAGGTSGAVTCPPGIPIVNQSVGGGTSAATVCDNGQGTAKFGERCLKSADCEPGTFCYSSQCTAICGGDARHTVGVVTSGASCSTLFGFAECGTRVQQSTAQNSVFFCAPTCAKDADCSVGEKCNEVTNYTNMPNGSQQWYTVDTVCTVN